MAYLVIVRIYHDGGALYSDHFSVRTFKKYRRALAWGHRVAETAYFSEALQMGGEHAPAWVHVRVV